MNKGIGEQEKMKEGIHRDYWSSALNSGKGKGPGIQMEEKALPWSVESSSMNTSGRQVPGNRYQ